MQLAFTLALGPSWPHYRRRRQAARRGAMSVQGRQMAQAEDVERLLLDIGRGDRAAFAALFSIAAPRVKRFLLSQGASDAAAEELAQDVMLTVWRKAALFDPTKGGAMTWIFVIARNRRIDSLRRERSATTYGATPPDCADEDAASPSDYLMGAERDARVRAAIDALSDDQREVVRRSFFDDETHVGIAEALGLPLGTVKSRLRLALKKLRAGLETPE
ncbi:MAG: sigma-70 family RNA polymerase sigma factor [Hyphomonadaceae bacterium]